MRAALIKTIGFDPKGNRDLFSRPHLKVPAVAVIRRAFHKGRTAMGFARIPSAICRV